MIGILESSRKSGKIAMEKYGNSFDCKLQGNGINISLEWFKFIPSREILVTNKKKDYHPQPTEETIWCLKYILPAISAYKNGRDFGKIVFTAVSEVRPIFKRFNTDAKREIEKEAEEIKETIEKIAFLIERTFEGHFIPKDEKIWLNESVRYLRFSFKERSDSPKRNFRPEVFKNNGKKWATLFRALAVWNVGMAFRSEDKKNPFTHLFVGYCPECKELFEKTRNDQVFCSKTCGSNKRMSLFRQKLRFY